MSEDNNTDPRNVERATVRHVTTGPNGCGHVGTTVSMRDLKQFRVAYYPSWVTVFGHPVDPTATVYLDEAAVTLTPAVWRAVIDALLEVLPPEVSARDEKIRANVEGVNSTVLADILAAEGL